MKPYPKGIFYLLSAPGGDFLTSLQTIETDGFMDKPWIDGARGRTGWSSICPSNSTPNWTQIDSALAICEAHGKKLTLSISSGNSVPSWVYTTQPLVTKFTALDATTMPLPWEENYQRKWESFIQAFGQRYDSNPLLASVFFTGMQNDVEMHVTTTPEDDIAYNAAAVAAGYANKSVAWIAATKTIMQMWINSFPNTSTILTTAPSPWDDTIQGGIDENAVENYARTTWGDKFGNSISFLHATVAHNNDPQRVTFPKGAQPIFASSDHTRFYSDPQPPVFPSDPIPMFDLFENAYDKGEQYLEVYDFDARHPVNEPTFISERLRLISNVPTKGLGDRGRISLAPKEGDTLEYPIGVWGQYGAGNDLPQGVASNVGLVGVGVSEDWNVIDKGPLANPRYDWSTLDPKIQQAIDAGLKVNLIITNSSDNTPQWLIDQEKLNNPSEVIDLIDPASNHSTFCKPISTVVYWNTAFHQARLDLAAAAGAHYASNTDIVAVTAQFANHNSNDWNIQDNVNQDPDFLECPMCPQLPPRLCGPIELDQPLQWLMAGWTEPKMVQVGKELMTAYANAFPRQNIKLPIGGLEDRLASEGRAGGGDYSAMARDIEEFIYGNGVDIDPQPYAGRFWLQRNIVDANWGDGFDHYDPASPDYAIPGTGAANYIKYMIYKHAQQTGPTPRHAGLQMVAAATGMADDCRLGGKSGGPCGYPVCPDLCVLNASMITAFSYNTTFIEVFPQDSANIAFDSLFIAMTLAMDGTPRNPPPSFICVGPSATGNGSGSDWNNMKAWSATPARGETWYLSDGAYTGKTLFTPVDDNTFIIIKKATVADHGKTTGWVDTLGDGQAAFSSQIQFTTSYWVFDGQLGGGPATTLAGWTTGYGFKVTETTSNAVIWFNGVGNIYINHTEITGNLAAEGGNGNDGILNLKADFSYSGSGPITISKCYLHDFGRTVCYHRDSPITFEYCFTGEYRSTSGEHAELAVLRSPQIFTFRWGVVTHEEGTGGFICANDTPANGLATAEIYGNVFYHDAATSWDTGNNGFIASFTLDAFMRNWKVYNNTFVNFPAGLAAFGITGESPSGNVAKNNYFYLTADHGVGSGWTQSFDHFQNSGSATGTNGTTGSGNPFTNYTAYDFYLLANTTAGTPLSAPYDVDAFGNLRTTWTRGAYEF